MSARHGGRHSTIVRCRSAISTSTRTSSRTRSGTLSRHHRCTRTTSVSGRPLTRLVCNPSRCDVHWNPPCHGHFKVGDAAVLESQVGSRGLQSLVKRAVVGGELTYALFEGGVLGGNPLD